MSLYDTSEIGSVKIVMLKGQDGQGAENIFALEGAGKMTSYFGNVIDTDILMNRAPRAGDRVLVYLDSSAVTPTSIKVYGENMSDPYTIPFLSTPDYLNGLCLIRLVDMLGSVAASLDFMDEVSLTAGDGISISGSTITNSKPQKGDNIKAYTMTDAISGDLGTFDGTVDYLMISFADVVSPNGSGEYTCTLSYGSTVKIGKLYDNKANGAFRENLAKGMTITVKTTGSGAGTAQDPIQMRVMAVDNGYVTAGRNYGTSASFGNRSTAEGDGNTASGNCSHVEGFSNAASGNYSHVGGSYNTAAYENQTVLGKYNSNKSDTLLEVGNGTATNARSNALEVTATGHVKDGLGNDMEALSALEATASGNPIVVNAQDVAAKGLKLTLEPIQSLHGYDKPWAGGAGKNKLPMTVSGIKSANTSGSWSGNVYTLNSVTITVDTDEAGNVTGIKTNGTASGDIFFSLATGFTLSNGSYTLNGCPASGSTGTYTIYYFNNEYSSSVYDTGSGATINGGTACFARILIKSGTNVSGKSFYPMVRASGDSTFAPYSNICPISGRTEVNIKDEGKNLFDGVFKIGENIANDGTIVTNNKCAYTLHSIASKGTLTVSTARAVSNIYLAEYDANNAFIRRNASDSNVSTYTVNLSSNCAYILVSFNYDNNTIVTQSIADSLKLQIEHGSSPTAYEPYIAPVNITIALGQTVYGGTLDVKTGVLTITHELAEYDGSNDESWRRVDNKIYQLVNNNFKIYDVNTKPPYIANIKEVVSNTWFFANNGNFVAFSTDHYIRCKQVIDITSVEDWRAYLASNPLQVCYELATPTTVQLTGEELEMLKGYNYITADGNIDLVYVPESISGLMEEVLVPISLLGTNESGNTKASRAYTSGEYFYQNGKMYKATTSIASGATFTVGTNCAQTTLFAELKAAQN